MLKTTKKVLQFLSIGASLLASTTPFAPSAQANSGQYIVAQHSGKCLHVHGGGDANGTQLTQWDCIPQGNVQWRIIPIGRGLHHIRSVGTGKCAHVHGGGNENGALITQWDCIRQGNVQWRLVPTGDGYYHIKNAQSGKCLHVHGGGNENAALITQWDCIQQGNVKWQITNAPASTPNNPPVTPTPVTSHRVKVWYEITGSDDGIADNTLELYGETRVNGNILCRFDRANANSNRREAGQILDCGETTVTGTAVTVNGNLVDADGNSDDTVFNLSPRVFPLQSGQTFSVRQRQSGGEGATLHIRID
jgi:hypothetical protein